MSLNFFSKPTSKDWPIAHVLLDDYEVVRVLGEGGMGKVYLVRSLSTGSQFAVKRAKGLKDIDRKSFLAELQTWIDLPEHPNLVPCRFFHTVGSEVLIFAEYIEGGSLHDWIASGRIYQGGYDLALERILDVAIQFAWGLHCLHELGTIHQDVKPGNVLMGADVTPGVHGIKPQVTDYGLARARAAAGEDFVNDPNGGLLVSSIRGTPAYWSPEQSQGMPLTHKADIWSWALSVLEIFTGGVTWMSGLGAASILEQYLQEDATDEDVISGMPYDLADLLAECFLPDPMDRPTSFSAIVDALRAIYFNSFETEYSRELHVIERAALPQKGINERRHATGTAWTDPQIWLERALLAAGRDPGEAAAMVTQRGVTRRGEMVAELIIYDEAKRLYEGLVFGGRTEMELDLASLCMNKGLVHSIASDQYGAMQEFDQAIVILERIVNLLGSCEPANWLATTYLYKANMMGKMGDHHAAIALCDQAIFIRRQLVYEQGRNDLVNSLSNTYLNKANALSALGDYHGAIALYDQVIDIREQLIYEEGRRELADSLGSAYMNKAVQLGALGDHREAVALYGKAITIRECLVNNEDRHDLSNDLAASYSNKANSLCELDNGSEALEYYDKAIIIRERLVNLEGRSELAEDLARLYMNKALANCHKDNHYNKIDLYEQAISIFDRLVKQEGRRDLANDLALTYVSKANFVSDLGGNYNAIPLYDQAILIRERLVYQEGRRELTNDLAAIYLNKAITISAMGDHKGAIALYDQAIALRERMVNHEGRHEISNDLAKTYLNKANAMIKIGEQREAVVVYDQALLILERLFYREGRVDLANILALACMNKSYALTASGDNDSALALLDQAIALREWLVNQKGSLKIANDLSEAYLNKAVVMKHQGDKWGALAACDQAVTIRERLVKQEGCKELAGDLAKLKVYRGEILIELRERAKGFQDLRSAHSILEAEILRTGRSDLKQIMIRLQQKLKQ